MKYGTFRYDTIEVENGLYDDNDQPLTPLHLVLGKRLLTPAKI